MVLQEIFNLGDYKKSSDCYKDVVKWKRTKRKEGFKVESIEDNGQVLVLAMKKGAKNGK